MTRPAAATASTPERASNGARYLGAGGTFRFEPPRLRTTGEPDEGRHATWFELFFDLVFVAAVSQLGTALAGEPTATGFARFAALFVVVVWAWVLYTLYANRFDTDDLVFRLAKSGAMLCIAAIAVNIRQAMEGRGGTVGFATGYVVMRVLLIALYLRARHFVAGEGRRLAEVYIVGYAATTGLWLVSIFVPGPYRYILWGVAMVVDLVIPTRAWATLRGHAVVVSHVTERFGTFFIIVLGESVVAVVAGVGGFELHFESWLIAAVCFVIALCTWWIYFDLADTSVVGRGALGLVYVYSHFPLLAGVAAFGVGTKLAIGQAVQPGLSAGTRWALAGGISAFALALAALHIGAEWTSLRDRTFSSRLCLAAYAVVLAAAGGGIAPLGFVGLVGAAVLAQLLLEALTPKPGAASVWYPPGYGAGKNGVANRTDVNVGVDAVAAPRGK
ncbi:MAG TPA: low temperature requirement protein A [Solirubrobacteraceae bacterium]|nr:low temperature requirement protein A [Solirubrobacteraceae bacterium]